MELIDKYKERRLDRKVAQRDARWLLKHDVYCVHDMLIALCADCVKDPKPIKE